MKKIIGRIIILLSIAVLVAILATETGLIDAMLIILGGIVFSVIASFGIFLAIG